MLTIAVAWPRISIIPIVLDGRSHRTPRCSRSLVDRYRRRRQSLVLAHGSLIACRVPNGTRPNPFADLDDEISAIVATRADRGQAEHRDGAMVFGHGTFPYPVQLVRHRVAGGRGEHELRGRSIEQGNRFFGMYFYL